MVDLLRLRPDVLRENRVKTALDKAAEAMEGERPKAALAIARRLRKEFDRAVRRQRD